MPGQMKSFFGLIIELAVSRLFNLGLTASQLITRRTPQSGSMKP